MYVSSINKSAAVGLFFLSTCAVISALINADYEEEAKPSWGRCPWIRDKLKNGRVKIRSRGRIAKFFCNAGYEMVGKRFATCVRGQWNNPVPICVAHGCYRLPKPANSQVTEMYQGALLVYDCLPGYVRLGPASLYCDGSRWSEAAPLCEPANVHSETACDFEEPNLCGWTHGVAHDFEWRRNRFSTPSGHVGTGPSEDTTFGPGKSGFYMYLEGSSPRKENDVARLFSPVFPSHESPGCFTFWYHMYGVGIGGLRVYIKPESYAISEITPIWEKYGDQGNQWFRGNVTIPDISENFQVVIEGVRGSSYESDIAIDDVNIVKDDCDSLSVSNASSTEAEFIPETGNETSEYSTGGDAGNRVEAETWTSPLYSISSTVNLDETSSLPLQNSSSTDEQKESSKLSYVKSTLSSVRTTSVNATTTMLEHYQSVSEAAASTVLSDTSFPHTYSSVSVPVSADALSHTATKVGTTEFVVSSSETTTPFSATQAAKTPSLHHLSSSTMPSSLTRQSTDSHVVYTTTTNFTSTNGNDYLSTKDRLLLNITSTISEVWSDLITDATTSSFSDTHSTRTSSPHERSTVTREVASEDSFHGLAKTSIFSAYHSEYQTRAATTASAEHFSTEKTELKGFFSRHSQRSSSEAERQAQSTAAVKENSAIFTESTSLVTQPSFIVITESSKDSEETHTQPYSRGDRGHEGFRWLTTTQSTFNEGKGGIETAEAAKSSHIVTSSYRNTPETTKNNTASVSGAVAAVFLLIGIVIIVSCYFSKRKKCIQDKLSEDSEIKFLSDNEVVEFYDSSEKSSSR